MADLADIAAATTAGYKEIVVDRGAGANPATRYFVTLEKQIVGGRQSGTTWRAFGESSTQARHVRLFTPGGRRISFWHCAVSFDAYRPMRVAVVVDGTEVISGAPDPVGGRVHQAPARTYTG